MQNSEDSAMADNSFESRWRMDPKLHGEIIRNMFEGVVLVRVSDATIMYANPRLERMFGYAPGELDGKPIAVLNYGDSTTSAQKAAEEIIEHLTRHEEGTFEIRTVKKDGTPFWCLARVSSFVHPEHGRMWISVLSDIDDRKSAEKRLRESEQRFRDLVEYLPETVYEMDLAGNLIFVNRQAFVNFGYSQDDLDRGLNGFDMIDPEDRDRARKNARRILEGGHLGLTEYKGLRKDGTTFPSMFHSSPVLRDGKPVGLIGFIIDITERKQAELEIKLYAQRLEQSNRELEDFTFVASHDLNEPLRKIQAFGSLLKRRHAAQLDEKGRDYLERMESAASRMQKLLKALLNYSRVGTQAGDLKPVNTTLIVQEAVNDLELLVQRVQGRVDIAPLPSLEADPDQLRQLFQNLIGNALKFRRMDVSPIVKVYGWVQQGSCQIFVEDNGIGFDESFFERIVKPFQRLHGRGEYEGMGMGLAICRKIVDRHGGRLTARSTPGEGSTFIVSLPLKRSRLGKNGEPSPEEGFAAP